MTNSDKHRASLESRRQVSTRPVSAGHAEQLNRYLGAALGHEEMRAEQERAQAPKPATPPPAVKPIVVGFDDSEASREAVRWAVAEADLRGCAVRAVIVDQATPDAPRATWIGSALPGDLAEWYQKYATAHRGRTAGDGLPGVELVRRTGRAPEVLVELSEQAQLLVLGTRGRGQVLDAVLGSVSRHCTRHAHCPVVIIPAPLSG